MSHTPVHERWFKSVNMAVSKYPHVFEPGLKVLQRDSYWGLRNAVAPVPSSLSSRNSANLQGISKGRRRTVARRALLPRISLDGCVEALNALALVGHEEYQQTCAKRE